MKDSGPGDFYDVVSARAGKKALLVTSSLPSAKWAGLFGDPGLADAIMTRLRMGSHALVLTGASASKEGEREKVAAHSGNS